MKNAYIVVSKCRKYFNDRGKRLSGDALEVLNASVEQLMCRASLAARQFKTVRAGEITHAYRQGSGLN